jgi:hypothetical protein
MFTKSTDAAGVPPLIVRKSQLQAGGKPLSKLLVGAKPCRIRSNGGSTSERNRLLRLGDSSQCGSFLRAPPGGGSHPGLFLVGQDCPKGCRPLRPHEITEATQIPLSKTYYYGCEEFTQ